MNTLTPPRPAIARSCACPRCTRRVPLGLAGTEVVTWCPSCGAEIYLADIEQIDTEVRPS